MQQSKNDIYRLNEETSILREKLNEKEINITNKFAEIKELLAFITSL